MRDLAMHLPRQRRLVAMLDRLLHHGHILKCGTELADHNGLSQPPPEGVKLPPSRAIPLAGFAVTIVGRI